MKTFEIKKTNEFSAKSKVFLNIGTKKIHVKGFGSFPVIIEPNESVFASQLWTQSNKITYENLKDKSKMLITPRLNKMLAFIILMVFGICTLVFLFTKNRWSFVPLIPFIIYVLLYLTVLKNRYLIIKEAKGE